MGKKQPKASNIMLDLETLGVHADAVIISIGAVRFDLHSDYIDDDGFYASISIESNNDVMPRRIEESTLIWWMQQDDAARKVFAEPKEPLYTALQDLISFINPDENPNIKVWSNGADFDIPMLSHAFATHGLETPWKFWNTGCYRTIKNLPTAVSVTKPSNPFAHNALSDALSQAEHLQKIWSVVFQDRTVPA